MNKEKTEKKLKSLVRKIQKTYLEYLDSLEDEGNEIGKKEGYLIVATFRDSLHIDSTTDEKELKKENQISWFYLNDK